MNILIAIYRRIYAFSNMVGELAKWLILGFIATISFDVFMRYVFNMPTVWSYDISYMLGGTMYLLGGVYCIRHDGHVRMDFLRERFSDRQKLIIDVVLSVLLFFPVMAILIKVSFGYTVPSWITRERVDVTYWAPLLFPFRTVVSLLFCFLGLAGIGWFIGNLIRLFGREKLD